MKSKKQVFWGVFFILGALLILATGMGIFPDIAFWKLIWTALAVALLLQGLFKGSFFCIFFAIAFLAIIYAKPLGITAITPWPVLGAALFLAIGCRLIFPAKKGKLNVGVSYVNKDGESIEIDREEGMEKEEKYSKEDGDYLEFSQVFKSGTKYINSDNLKRVDIESVFCSMDIYLDNAIIQGDSATIEMESVFSNVTFFIPKTWTVVENSENVFSGVSFEGRNTPDGMHKLYLNGSHVFGGVKIIYI